MLLFKYRQIAVFLGVMVISILFQSASVFAQATDSDSVSGSLNLDCSTIFADGYTRLSYTASLSAEISPYITGATNDAELAATFSVQTSKNNNNCASLAIPPSADPRVYFGTGGSFNSLYSNAAPYRSTIRISREGDRFQNGTYQVSGSDGAESFNLAIGVAVGPVGVSADVPNNGPVILLGTNDPKKIDIGNVLYTDNLLTRFRGAFHDNSSFTLSNFLMRTGTDSEAEYGEVIISIPAFKTYRVAGVVPKLELTGDLVGGRYLSTSVRYIRGDYLREPEFEFVASRSVIEIGDKVDVDVIIRNRSGSVALSGGTVTLDTSTLAPVLFPLVSPTQSFGKINHTTGFRKVTFSFQAFQAGQVNLQASVEGDWAAPVPPTRDFGGSVSLAGGIRVSATPLPIFEDQFESEL